MTGATPLMVVDGAGVVVRWSRRAREIWLRSDSEAVGRAALTMVAPDTWASGTSNSGTSGSGTSSSGSGTEPGAGPLLIHDVGGNPVDLRVQVVPLSDGAVAWGVFEADDGPAPDSTRTAVFDILRANTHEAFFVLDSELRVLSVNEAACALCDIEADKALDRPVADVCRPSHPQEFEDVLRGVLTDGTSVTGYVVRLGPPDGSSPERFAKLSAFPLKNARGVVVSMTEVTETLRTKRRLEALGSVRERVGRSLDVVTTCQELVDALVPGFADIAVVDVVDAVVRGEDPPLSPLGRDIPLRRAAFRNGKPSLMAQAYPVGDVRALPTPTPYSQVLSDLKPRAVALDSGSPWLDADPERARAIRASGARLLLTAPLALRGAVLGLLSLYRVQPNDAFDQNDLSVAHELATHTALSLDNARRYTHEHTIAAALQRHLLPPEPPSQTAIEFAPLHVPAEAGAGSWYDAFGLPGARTALAIGEVSGSGIDAATTMGQLRTVIHSLAALDLEPDELLARLNDAVVRLADERAALPPSDPLHQQPLSAGCVYAVHDPLHGVCVMASAGHPGPVVAHPGGVVHVPEIPTGPLLGSRDGPPFATASVPMRDGSVLALRTTSFPVSEGPDGDRPNPLGEALTRLNRPLRDVRDDILYRLRDTSGQHDVLLLLARTRAFPPDQVATWALDSVPTAAAAARHHARERLGMWRVGEETSFATELIVSELVTNALRYGAPPIRLRLVKDSTLTCEVSDAGGAAPRLRHARTVDEGGRGLFICAQMSHNWGIRYSAQGKTIWTEQTLP
ncbi:SpoIIE family protein phosphatase [Streptomyces rhizosphaerihabitans]|uniref:SpoIIE family protein phosphatase n=1 Tax=Streptomyces rhizosphaerihabitans TaxID=1266770 RepID=UPI0021C25113|nr:SpoIIE family protein phosphatase [Streptomyces rhizosphaerihabitans]MCT9007903.1 SpoIIE family protein phosphatase [Streptomyces rhizosphaerihabitans]